MVARMVLFGGGVVYVKSKRKRDMVGRCYYSYLCELQGASRNGRFRPLRSLTRKNRDLVM